METPKHPNTQIPNLTPEQLAELKQYKWNPTHDENICANCSQIVEARADCEWSDGDLCDVCAQTVLGRILELLPQLLAAAERAMMETSKDPNTQIPNLTRPEAWTKEQEQKIIADFYQLAGIHQQRRAQSQGNERQGNEKPGPDSSDQHSPDELFQLRADLSRVAKRYGELMTEFVDLRTENEAWNSALEQFGIEPERVRAYIQNLQAENERLRKALGVNLEIVIRAVLARPDAGRDSQGNERQGNEKPGPDSSDQHSPDAATDRPDAQIPPILNHKS